MIFFYPNKASLMCCISNDWASLTFNHKHLSPAFCSLLAFISVKLSPNPWIQTESRRGFSFCEFLILQISKEVIFILKNF